MDIGSILLILALLLLVGLFVSRPLFERRATAVTESEHQISALLAERDRILTALGELDFDHDLGKIPADEYPVQRDRLLKNGAQILRQIDAFQGETSSSEDSASPWETASQEPVEEALHASPPSAISEADEELEALIATRRRVRQDKASGFCHECGGPIQKSDRFCPKCGTTVT
jgi:hypothetical protein